MTSSNNGNYVGIFPFLFGGWPNRAARIHDFRYEAMKAGRCTMTLTEVDDEFLDNLLKDAKKGRCQWLKHRQAYVLYGIAHSYGLVMWRGKR